MIEQVPDETLVAYLDGELAAVEATQVEVQLKANESLRRRLDELRGTWELLGDLPLEQPDPRLAETTIELIGLSLERSHETWLDRCYRYRWWLTTCAGVLGLLLGVFWSQWQHERNERQLLERVPVLANFKLLQELVSPVWLEKIASIPELEELTPAPYEKPVFSMVTVPPGLEERTAWVKGLSNAEKKRLRDNAHSLDSLDEEKRQSLQSLSEMVFQDTPQGQEYRSAVQGYARLL
ncbi:MAG: hypothetical protein KDB03_13750, partial [Planctomycetales bacterium]|nr:hypothetical protein [Planctomycetales bacterium]